MGAQFVEFCRMALREFGFAWLPLTLFLAVGGLASAYKRDRTAFWFLLLIVLADLAYSLSYEIAEDKDAYYLPAFISIAIAAGPGIRWLIQFAASRRSSIWRPYVARFAKDDVVNIKILPAYTRMLTNRGRYLALFNQHERAILAFKEALALDPNLGAAQQGLAESTTK